MSKPGLSVVYHRCECGLHLTYPVKYLEDWGLYTTVTTSVVGRTTCFGRLVPAGLLEELNAVRELSGTLLMPYPIEQGVLFA